MIHKTTLVMFTRGKPAPDLIDNITDYLNHRSITINPDLPTQETSKMVITECYHDQPSPTPCTVIYSWPPTPNPSPDPIPDDG